MGMPTLKLEDGIGDVKDVWAEERSISDVLLFGFLTHYHTE